jgi:photosystem II stability/assembly factor-like uncharacterized protein
MLRNKYTLFYSFLMFLILLSFAKDTFALDYWVKQNTSTDTRLLRCSFPDTSNGWACGDMGTIIHTSNGGTNWIIQSTPIDFYIHDIYFINKNTGWAIANEFFYEGSIILSTTNAGQTWDTTQFQDTTIFLTTIHYTDSLNGWVGAITGHIYKTTNAGLDWTYTPNDSGMFSSFRINRFRFFSQDYGYAVGGQIDIVGSIWRTDNSGGLWTSQGLSPEPVYDIHFFDSLNLMATGGDPDYGAFILRSSNAGINWDYKSINIYGQGEAIAHRTANEFWMPLAYAETFAMTTDAGNNWVEVPVTQTLGVWDAQFVTPDHGWTVGDSGLVLKFNPDAVSINNQTSSIPNSLTLHQNYPNPFNPSTTIEYELTKPGYVKLYVYDISGKQIDYIDLGAKFTGNYKFRLNANKYPSGVYYYKLTAGDFSQTKKMVLLK